MVKWRNLRNSIKAMWGWGGASGGVLEVNICPNMRLVVLIENGDHKKRVFHVIRFFVCSVSILWLFASSSLKFHHSISFLVLLKRRLKMSARRVEVYLFSTLLPYIHQWNRQLRLVLNLILIGYEFLNFILKWWINTTTDRSLIMDKITDLYTFPSL